MDNTTNEIKLPPFCREWLQNIYDHRRQDAESKHYYSSWATNDPQRRRKEWEWHLLWIKTNIIGPPQATSSYSVEQLEKMGMIGIYVPSRLYSKEKDEAQYPPAQYPELYK